MIIRKLIPGLLVFFIACAPAKKKLSIEEEERNTISIHPASTVLNVPKQFVIKGHDLHSAELICSKSVKLQNKIVDTKGRTIKFMATIDVLENEEPLAKYGERTIQVKKLEEIETVLITILDERKK
ncbi:MAG: hypothetical protein HQK83_09735 [Fibrobacteria bacterium]|nr:hypothetical protein [Fibrobacteria bacterium]